MTNRMARFAIGFLLGLLLVGLGTPALHAEIRVEVNKGNIEPLPIALPDLFGRNEQEADFGRRLAGVISNDLQRSGLFRPISAQAFIQDRASLQVQPRFGDWRQINAQALVVGNSEFQPDGRLRVEFRLWDVFAQQQMIGFRYETAPNNWRQVAHRIADSIYQRVTGEEGYFDTRIVYVSEEGRPENRIKRLAIMDQDGANHRFLTDGSALVLTPRFSPTAQEITYLSYSHARPRVNIYNIDTGQQEVLGDFPGMTFAPRFSPDGNQVIMSLAQEGNSDIYTMDLRTRGVRRLTNHPAIDTSPSFSPDGRQVVFNSDRGGSQQLYVMDSSGGDVKRISFAKGRYATPVWSPRGDLIAFTKIERGTFYIGVMRPNGTGERLLVEGYLVEGPTWAPNGRVLMYFRDERRTGSGGGSPKLYSIDLTGYNEREIVTPKAASDPAWSPLKK